MNLQAHIQPLAERHFLGILNATPHDSVPYKVFLPVEIHGEVKPLLLTGTVHGQVEDGSCIALLNPDQELIDRACGGLGGNRRVFREIVADHCDFALALWIDAYLGNRVLVGGRYEAKQPSPARFVVGRSGLH